MRKIALLLFLLPVYNAGAQTAVEKNGGLKKQLIADSTVMQKLQEIRDSAILQQAVPDAEEIKESVSRNAGTILEFQREREAKQKKAAMIRIAIGLGFLAILVIGLLRRRKKQG
jgi:hypothetical protein